ncbi:NmrA-like family protein [Eremomyces bilateralis CBS 781.70]|uniref:NmrA-like family protein n=1 Tax=Eremomyces bilateralis CBS 781.70 TaxID=1392243 RepID=A0A6G1G1Q4_9PEZI|nr:NmrA-like family protein [Eremomyces bilateralis CBS 781.70]KAF1811948.1 NmrA-like family protein [Eremomyces bilateralis CBS 781.70]
MTNAILITGATGQQGGAVIDALLATKADFEILAVTRDTASPSATKLAQKSPSIKLVQGNLDDVAAVFQSAKKATSRPIWGVFSVQLAIGVKSGTEERQGKALIDHAIQSGVQYFVYASVDRGGATSLTKPASLTNPTNVPHFIAKHRVEEHLFAATKDGASGMAWTILRPTAYMENFLPTFFGRVFVTAWAQEVRDRPLQMVGLKDIGVFAAKAFVAPEQWAGKAVSLAGDEVTLKQVEEVFKTKTGKELPRTYGFVSWFIMWMAKDFRLMMRWFYDHGFKADIAALRKEHPELKDFRTWLEKDSQFEMR